MMHQNPIFIEWKICIRYNQLWPNLKVFVNPNFQIGFSLFCICKLRSRLFWEIWGRIEWRTKILDKIWIFAGFVQYCSSVFIIIGVLSGTFWLPVYGFGRAIARWNRLGVKTIDPWEFFASRAPGAKMLFTT